MNVIGYRSWSRNCSQSSQGNNLSSIDALALSFGHPRKIEIQIVYTTPEHLRPVALWRLRLADGAIASCRLGPTAREHGVAWYLDDVTQDCAAFPERDAAERWADDVRRMLTAPTRA
jgi:hypothetical protein